MIALALMLAVPQDTAATPPVTDAVTEALGTLGKVARASAEPKASTVFVSVGCGSGWNSYSLSWQRPGDTAPRRWGQPAKPPKAYESLPDEAIAAAVGDLCDRFGAALTEDQFFEVIWSMKDGAAQTSVGAIKENASWEMDAMQHMLAFFGTTAAQTVVVPRKPARR